MTQARETARKNAQDFLPRHLASPTRPGENGKLVSVRADMARDANHGDVETAGRAGQTEVVPDPESPTVSLAAWSHMWLP
jgi:hypothetical protein